MVVMRGGMVGCKPTQRSESIKLGLGALMTAYMNIRASGCGLFETIQPDGANIIYLKFTDYFVGKLGLSGNVLNFNGYSEPKHFHLNKAKEVV
jgi:hypothetical protein